MLTARDIMTPNPITVQIGSKVTEAAKILLDKHFNGLPVVNPDGSLAGVLCQSDLVAQHKKFSLPSFFIILDSLIPLKSPKKFEDDIRLMTAVQVEDIMTAKPLTISPATGLTELASLMADGKHYTLPVVEGGKLIGVVGKEDILRAVAIG